MNRAFVLLISLFVVVSQLSAQVVYVDDDAPLNGTGQSWTTAYRYLQDALQYTLSNGGVTEIRVARGIYRPDQDESGAVTPGDRGVSFQLIDNVSLKGGYAGYGSSQPDGRDIENYITVLSGDLASDDLPGFINNSENSYRVVVANSMSSNCLMEGFYISGGNDSRGNPEGSGAGAYIIDSDLSVRECRFVGNCVRSFGGAIYNENGSPVFLACTFRENRAGGASPGTFGGDGGGIYNIGSNSNILSCRFIENEASYGGGVFISECSPTVNGCLFVGNIAGSYGGGVSNFYGADSTLVNSVFRKNSAETGGGVYNYSSTPVICNSTISENTGGGVYGSYCVVANCILWGNISWGFIEAQQLLGTGTTMLAPVSCCIEGLSAYSGDGNIGAEPLYVNPDGVDGIPGTEDDDLRLSGNSPCINAGDNVSIPLGVVTDADSLPRINDCVADIGAYEYQREEHFGDADGNCKVDLADYAEFASCLVADFPERSLPLELCYQFFDSDNDSDVDLVDFAEFQKSFTGP